MMLAQQHRPRAPPKWKLSPLQEGEDIECFLVTFERTMVMQNIEKDKWVQHLLPILTGIAQEAYYDVNVDTGHTAEIQDCP